jgi:hypothetical protein
VTFSWEANDGVKSFILDPGNNALSSYQRSDQVTPAVTTTYHLRAIPLTDQYPAAEKQVTVTVEPKEVCIAQIDRFAAPKGNVYVGDRVRLSWSVRYATNARIDSDHPDRISLGAITPRPGSQEVTITDPTTFTLTVADNLGNRTSKTVTVTPKPRPALPEALPNPPSDNGTGESAPPPGTANP